MKYKRINLLDSVNPLESPLWPSKIVDKILKSDKPYFLQLGGWEGLFGSNDLPCLILPNGKQSRMDILPLTTCRWCGHSISPNSGNGWGITKECPNPKCIHLEDNKDGNGNGVPASLAPKGKHQYPYTWGIDIHKLVALVCVPNPDPKNLTVVDHVNIISNGKTRFYAAILHDEYGRNQNKDAGKMVWGEWNLIWKANGDNIKDAITKEHLIFEKRVPFLTSQKVVDRKLFHQDYEGIEDLKDKASNHVCCEIEKYVDDQNTQYWDWLADELNDAYYYDHIEYLLNKIRSRKCTKEEYREFVRNRDNWNPLKTGLCGSGMPEEFVVLDKCMRHHIFENFAKHHSVTDEFYCYGDGVSLMTGYCWQSAKEKHEMRKKLGESYTKWKKGFTQHTGIKGLGAERRNASLVEFERRRQKHRQKILSARKKGES